MCLKYMYHKWMKNFIFIFISLILLTSCGGGGGGGSSDSLPVPSSPSIGITFSSNVSVVNPGEASQLSWTSTNASSCEASGAWSGNKTLSGNENVTPNNRGTSTYSLSCTSGSSSLTKSVDIDVSIKTIDVASFELENIDSYDFNDSVIIISGEIPKS